MLRLWSSFVFVWKIFQMLRAGPDGDRVDITQPCVTVLPPVIQGRITLKFPTRLDQAGGSGNTGQTWNNTVTFQAA